MALWSLVRARGQDVFAAATLPLRIQAGMVAAWLMELGRGHSTQKLANDLARAGIAPGDHLIVHSSLRAVGRAENGAATVLDALLAAVGPHGNLMVPTYTYSLPVWNADPFDYGGSASRVGTLTEAVRARPGSIRSFHPTHSVCVIGPDAEAITTNHLHSTPIGRRSPFDRMLARNAKILMLGTHQDTNSSLHLCEVLAGLPYVDVAFNDDYDYEMAWFFNEQRQIEYAELHEIPGCSRGFRAIEEPLARAGVLRQVQLGDATSQLLEMRALVGASIPILQREPTLLLCHIENCAICPRRRAFMEKHSLA